MRGSTEATFGKATQVLYWSLTGLIWKGQGFSAVLLSGLLWSLVSSHFRPPQIETLSVFLPNTQRKGRYAKLPLMVDLDFGCSVNFYKHKKTDCADITEALKSVFEI